MYDEPIKFINEIYKPLFYVLFFFFLIINLSNAAIIAGNKNKISSKAHKVPCDNTIQIFDIIPELNIAIIKVAIIKIEDDVNMVLIDLL